MKCIIIDDEPIALRGLKRLIEKDSRLEIIGAFDSAKESLLFLKDNDVELIFLDIQMPEINGLELAKILDNKALVIFTSAYPQYAIDSYEVNAIDYILKPINRNRLSKAIDRAIATHNLLNSSSDEIKDIKSNDTCLIVKSERKYMRIQIMDILFIQGLKDYSMIQLEDSKVVTHLTLKALMNILPQGQFIRISKSYVVNKSRVRLFDSNDVEILNYTLPIGSSYREDAIEKLLKL